MSEQFKKIGPGAVESTNGFTLRMKDARGGITYRDETGEVFVDSEFLTIGGYVLYRPREEPARRRFESILPDVVRAMGFLGFPTRLHQESTWGDVTWTPEDLELIRRHYETAPKDVGVNPNAGLLKRVVLKLWNNK